MFVGRAIQMLSLTVLANGNDFLSAEHQLAAPISRDEVEQTLLLELAMEDVMAMKFETELRTLFATMPKNEHDNLEPSSVRYVLHRYFAQKHGWHIIGLDRNAGSWNASKPTSMLKDQIPTYIENFFEERMKSKGLGLRELAVLAATLSDLAAREAVNELDYIYSALKVRDDRPINDDELKKVFRAFQVAKIWGTQEGDAGRNLKSAERQLEDTYLGWSETKMWVSDEIQTFDFLRRDSRNPFVEGHSFESAVSMASELNHRHSQLHFRQCKSLKNQLIDLEHQGTGRVLLDKFYSGSAASHWPFVEKKEYLRATGALDESNPNRPSVIIQNYLLSPAQCLETSGYYSLCCKDECEDILAQIEAAAEAPSMTPQKIIEIVSLVSSESVHAPRNISAALKVRLQEIADYHSGEVPLHGRLFAQWLHHAYPQECSFPHVSGTVTHQSPSDWAADRGFEDANEDEYFLEAEMQKQRMSPKITDANVDPLPWNAVEELVSVHKRGVPKKEGFRSWWGRVRVAVVFAAIISLAYSMPGVVHGGVSPQKKVECHLV